MSYEMNPMAMMCGEHIFHHIYPVGYINENYVFAKLERDSLLIWECPDIRVEDRGLHIAIEPLFHYFNPFPVHEVKQQGTEFGKRLLGALEILGEG